MLNDTEVGLGTIIEKALTSIGVTSTRVSKWLGKPCQCPERVEKLNRLSRWATRVIKGRIEGAQKYLLDLLNEER